MSIHKDLEQIKLVALHYAKEHKCNYNVILLNPNEDGAFDALASTYEYVLDSYFDKERDNVVLIAKTDDILREEREEDDYLLKPLLRQSEQFMAFHIPNITMPFTLKENPPQYKRTAPKINRNALCTCGSGKKFKKCCLNSN